MGGGGVESCCFILKDNLNYQRSISTLILQMLSNLVVSEVKSTCCSFRGPAFGSQQSPVTPGELMPSTGLHGYVQAWTLEAVHIHRSKTIK